MKKIYISFLVALCFCAFTNKANAAWTGAGTAASPWQIGDGSTNTVAAVKAKLVDNTLTVFGTGNMADFLYSIEGETPWRQAGKHTLIKTVVIESGITNIGDVAFLDCNNLQWITIPEGVRIIGERAFENCNHLFGIAIPTSVTTIESSAFKNATNITSVYCPSTTPPSISSNAFEGVNIGSKYLAVPLEQMNAYKANAVWGQFVVTPPYVMVEGSSDATYDVAIMGLDGSVVYYEYQDAARTIPRRATGYKAKSESESQIPDFVVDFNPEGKPALIATKDGTTIHADGYTDNSFNIAIQSLSIAGEYFSLDNVSLDNLTHEFTDKLFGPENLTEIIGSILNNIAKKLVADGFVDIGDIFQTTVISNIKGTAVGAVHDGLVSLIPKELIDAALALIPDETLAVVQVAYSAYALYGNVQSTMASCGLAFSASGPLVAIGPLGWIIELYLGYRCVRDVYETMMKAGKTAAVFFDVFSTWKNANTCSVTAKLTGGTLVIAGDGALCTHLLDEYADRKSEITKLVIRGGVTSIPINAFSGYSNLQSVRIEEGTETLTFITGVNTIYRAFYGSSVGNLYLGRNITYDYCVPFEENTKLTSLTIGNKVTAIGANCFNGCSGLTSLTIESGSRLTSIGNNAFNGCNKVATALNIPAGVKTIGTAAFNGCEKLPSLVIPNSVASIGYAAFAGCKNFQSVTIEEGSETLTFVTGVNIIYRAFYGSSVGNLYLGRNISYDYCVPFEGDTLLTSLTIGNKVTAIGTNCFNGCNGLTSLTIESGSRLTSIGNNAFNGCNKVATALNIPAGVKTIGTSAFNSCEKLPSLVIPNSVDSIGYAAFAGCKNLQSVTIEEGSETLTFVTGVNTIYRAFYGSSVGNLYLGRNISYDYCVPFEGNTLLTSLTIGSNVTAIDARCFSGCSGLTEITSKNPTPPQVYNYDSFKDVSRTACKVSVPTGSLSDYKAAAVWKDFYSIEEGGNTSPSTTPSSDLCSNATNLSCGTLVQGTTEGATPTTGISYGTVAGSYTADKNDVFYKFTATTAGIYTVTLNNPNPVNGSSGNDINVALYSDCGATSGLAELIGDGTVETMQYTHTGGTATYIIRVFSYNNAGGSFSIKVTCPATAGDGTLTWQIGNPNAADVTATLDNGTLTISGTGAMQDFSNTAMPWYGVKDEITGIIINNGVTTIGTCAFEAHTNLSVVIIPSSVTDIGSRAFAGCTDLTSISLPSSITSIGQESFRDCSNLSAIYCNSPTPPSVGDNSFSGVDQTSCRLYVPVSAAYKAAAGWNDFYSINAASIQPISNDNISITSTANGISIETTAAVSVSVYTILGQKAYQSIVNGNTNIYLRKGIYVVRYGDESRKVIVK
ncbi:MAG: leucine-rich repeat protein [Tannerella sp.]|jgi:hypothetical protein|nr:leucine-rich repeat protein [Tannerella sp.]